MGNSLTGAARTAAQVKSTALDIASAATTYARCPPGGKVRDDVLEALNHLRSELVHLLFELARKHGDEHASS